MRWNRRVMVCCSSLVLFGLAGCAKHVKIKIGDRTLAPITGTSSPGDTLEWVAVSPGESFSIHWQEGLCKQGTPNPIPASYGNPARCVVAAPNPKQAPPQTPQQAAPQAQPAPQQNPPPPSTSTEYTYTIEGTKDGKPFTSPDYTVSVGPHGCHICP